MIEPEWISYDVVLAIHDAQIAEHGGLPGIRENALIESGLARPQNLFHYSQPGSLLELAAAYVFGIANNHGFVDGNKRTGWIVGATFLEINGVVVEIDEQAVIDIMLGVADSGTVTEEQFVAWLGEKIS